MCSTDGKENEIYQENKSISMTFIQWGHKKRSAKLREKDHFRNDKKKKSLCTIAQPGNQIQDLSLRHYL